jgi:hypothetical protein
LQAEPSETLKGFPSLKRTFELGYLPLAECERRARGAKRLREQYTSIPYYVQRAKGDPDDWSAFSCSRVNC